MTAVRVAMLCVGKVGAVMSSPSIRAYELGRALSAAGAEVRMLAPALEDADALELPCVRFEPRRGIGESVAGDDVVVAQPQWPRIAAELRRSGARLVFDLFYPDLLEKLERRDEEGRSRALRASLTRDRFNRAIRTGHHLICGSERQRDMWLGSMLALGVIGPDLYDRDPSLRKAIDVVPFGLPEEPAGAGPRPWGRFGIEDDAEVVLWNGGIWPWLDAPTAVRAMAALEPRRPQARLVFMAGGGEEIAKAAADNAKALAAELGVLDRTVYFNPDWVPYAERGAWMAAAHCGLLCHGAGLEAHFSQHSRVLDCYWARLPPVSTSGDVFADEIEREHLGGTASPGDPDAVAAAIDRVLERGRASFEPALARAAERYRWSEVAKPLVRYALEARPTPRLGGRAREPIGALLRGGGFRAIEALRARR